MTKYFKIKKGYVRIGKSAYTNIIIRFKERQLTINLSSDKLINLLGFNSKVIYF